MAVDSFADPLPHPPTFVLSRPRGSSPVFNLLYCTAFEESRERVISLLTLGLKILESFDFRCTVSCAAIRVAACWRGGWGKRQSGKGMPRKVFE